MSTESSGSCPKVQKLYKQTTKRTEGCDYYSRLGAYSTMLSVESETQVYHKKRNCFNSCHHAWVEHLAKW